MVKTIIIFFQRVKISEVPFEFWSHSPIAMSVEADAKTGLGANVPKTPVSLLQELYVRKGITPKYDLVQIEGAVHEPTFKYRVSVGDVVATGCGASKKKAKHEAAKSILTKLKTGAKDLPNLDLMSPYDDGISGNPVGELQEICMNRRMQPPVYEVSLEEGAPHERNFVINCLVGSKFRESGCGKSKKIAKRKAAAKMLATLKAQPVLIDDSELGGVGANLVIDEDELVQGIAQRTAMLKLNQDQQPNNNLAQMTKFYRNLKTNEGTQLASLQDMDEFEANAASYELLDEVSDEQGLSLTYVDVEERSKSGKYHCFVQLASNPVAVCFGIGINDAKEARYDAAKNALEYLRIMTK